jgi:hypothetical protein
MNSASLRSRIRRKSNKPLRPRKARIIGSRGGTDGSAQSVRGRIAGARHAILGISFRGTSHSSKTAAVRQILESFLKSLTLLLTVLLPR